MAKNQQVECVKNGQINETYRADSSLSNMTAMTNDDYHNNRPSLQSSNISNLNDNDSNRKDNSKSADHMMNDGEFKVYRIRFLLLTIFSTLSASNSFHWIEYAIIEAIVRDYYHITTFWVNCTSVIYMFIYIVGISLSTYMQDRYGMRICLIIGSFINTLGSWIKCASIDRSRFFVAMSGQTMVAIAQLFTLNIPPMLAAQWFPLNEVTRATSFGVFGNQVGIALGFLIPPLVMPDLNSSSPNQTTTELSHEQIAHIERGFRILSYGLSALTTILFFLVLFVFKERPEHPPSKAQAMLRLMEQSEQKQSYLESIKQLAVNKNFVLLLINYGLMTGVFYALSTVISQMITRSLGENYLAQAGYMGLIITLSGVLGSIICGYLLGWSGRFSLVNILIYLFSLAGTAAFAIAIQIRQIYLLYATCAILGFFMTGYLPIGFEFAAEVSYPQPESTSAGLLNASAQIFGIIFTYASTPIIENFSAVWANIGYIIVLTIGVFLSLFIQNDLRRRNAHIHTNV